VTSRGPPIQHTLIHDSVENESPATLHGMTTDSWSRFW